MSQMLRSLLESLRRAVGMSEAGCARRPPFQSRRGGTPDPLADKLKDIRYEELEDDETTRRQVAKRAADGDGLAETIYKARPQNPLGKEF